VGAAKLQERTLRNPQSRESRPVTTKQGFNVQANAAVALARRGSARVRLDLLEEMLAPDRLREIFVLKYRDGTEKPDEALVAQTLTNALKAVVQLHRKRPQTKLDKLKPLIDDLANSDNAEVRAEAKQTQLALK
jgi:hypothetical protein